MLFGQELDVQLAERIRRCLTCKLRIDVQIARPSVYEKHKLHIVYCSQ
jgi:hypothetical protein